MNDVLDTATPVRLGFVRLLDAAPLMVARECGFFAEEGLNVTLMPEVSWATLRDKVTVGLLDGAHMLAPMAFAIALGLGAPREPLKVPLVLSRNGNGITLSSELAKAVDRQCSSRHPGATAQALAREAARTGRPLRFAVVYAWSSHYLQLRDWLAAGGLHPGQQVELVTVPPTKMVESLRRGDIDGCCVGEPWNSLAETAGIGRLVVSGHDLWPNSAEKVLGLRQAWVDDNPQQTAGLIRAILKACRWIESQKVEKLVDTLSLPPYLENELHALGRSQGLFHARIGQHFFKNEANRPRLEEAQALFERMQRWQQVTPEQWDLVADLFQPGLYRQAVDNLDSVAEV
ncbi:CmpA/NrtA family ABC transporter substrate-binding protein [Marinobacteraceae bacterium S3BR75-40.1]